LPPPYSSNFTREGKNFLERRLTVLKKFLLKRLKTEGFKLKIWQKKKEKKLFGLFFTNIKKIKWQ